LHRAKAKQSFGSTPSWSWPKTMAFPSVKYPCSLESLNGEAMKSGQHGASTSQVEITNISPQGFWLLLGERELFVSFKEFPWFEQASVAKISKVEWPSDDHLYWPELDIDLSVQSIEHPEQFPLKFAPSNSA
jgi:hypothetical protein